MVYRDISVENSTYNHKTEYKPQYLYRFLSAFLDYLLLGPVITFLVTVYFNDGLRLINQFPKSSESVPLFILIVAMGLVLVSFLQALFIAYYKATPGQLFLKIKVKFLNKEQPIFWQAFVRQLGFWISFLLLGLPFYSLLVSRNRTAFYEKLSESYLSTTLKNETKWNPLQYQFLKASFNTYLVFTLTFLFVNFFGFYESLLSSFISYNNNEQKNIQQICQIDKINNPEDRLTYLISMNLMGQVSDDCLNEEAQFHLWKSFDPKARSLAFFAKFVLADNSISEQNYLKEACKYEAHYDGCLMSQYFKTENPKVLEQLNENNSFLALIIKTENQGLSQNWKSDFKKYLNQKTTKKYLISQLLNPSSKTIQKRNLAQFNDPALSTQYDEQQIQTQNSQASIQKFDESNNNQFQALQSDIKNDILNLVGDL